MPQFHETVAGNRFINGLVPRAIAAVEKLAAAIDKHAPSVARDYKYFVIFDPKERLFWSNTLGWVDASQASKFSDAEKEEFKNLPAGGEWSPAGEGLLLPHVADLLTLISRAMEDPDGEEYRLVPDIQHFVGEVNRRLPETLRLPPNE